MWDALTKVRWAMVCMVLGGRMASASSYEELIAEAKNRVVATRDCAFNRDIEIDLKSGQAVRLNCPTNEHHITDFLLYYYETSIDGKTEGIIRTDAFFANGNTSGGGSRISLDGALRQAGYTRCLVVTQWRPEGDTLHVKFRASDDLKYNQEFRRFLLRGLMKVNIELGWLAISHNIRKVHRITEVNKIAA